MQVHINNDCEQLMSINKQLIKGEYLTYQLFVDSAIRGKLRRMGVDTGDDLILSHLKKKRAGKLRHLDMVSVNIAIRRHEERLKKARIRLDGMDV